MATMKQAIKEAFEQSEGALSKEVIRQFVDERYPGIWQPSTLTAHLYACAINNPKSYIHHPHAKRFLYKNADGTFELYDEGSYGPNIWTPDEAEDIEDAAQAVEASIGLERDIEDQRAAHFKVEQDAADPASLAKARAGFVVHATGSSQARVLRALGPGQDHGSIRGPAQRDPAAFEL